MNPVRGLFCVKG